MDCSLPDSSVHAILHARILEWAAILPNPGIEHRSPALQADSSASVVGLKSVCVCVCVCVGMTRKVKKERLA